MDPTDPPAHPDRPNWLTIFREFNRREVRFVVVGGVAAILQGAPIMSRDLDLVPDPSPENLTRVSKALVAQRAHVVGVGRVLDLSEGEWLRASRFWNFDTTNGRLDLLLAPDGVDGWEALAATAEPVTLEDGTSVLVASVKHLIAMKEAAGRAKDHFVLPTLRWLQARKRDSGSK